LSRPHSLSLFQYFSLSLTLCLSFNISLSLSLTLSLSHSLTLSLSHSLSLSFSLSPSLPLVCLSISLEGTSVFRVFIALLPSGSNLYTFFSVSFFVHNILLTEMFGPFTDPSSSQHFFGQSNHFKQNNFEFDIFPIVNFINSLHTNFLYKHCFGSFFYVHVTRENLPKQHLYEKLVRNMLMKLTPTYTVW